MGGVDVGGEMGWGRAVATCTADRLWPLATLVGARNVRWWHWVVWELGMGACGMREEREIMGLGLFARVYE